MTFQTGSEGGNVFGGGSRTPVTIAILVKNPNAAHDGCRIHYRDIGDYLNREEKLAALRYAVSIAGFSDWQEITPDKYHDWIAQRNDAFANFYPFGSKDTKAGVTDDAIFRLYSQGLNTARDAYIYNFSRDACAENAQRMTADYLAALSEIEQNPELTGDAAARRHSLNLKWNDELKNDLNRKKKTQFEEGYIRKVLYRPFVATNCYADYTFITRKSQMDLIFPDSSSENRVICVPGKGLKNPFSAIVVDMMTDFQMIFNGQCFPRYRYQKPTETSDTMEGLPGIE